MFSSSYSSLSLSLLTFPPLSSPKPHRTRFLSPRAAAAAAATTSTHNHRHSYASDHSTNPNRARNNNFTYLINPHDMAMAACTSSLYEVLGIQVGATSQEIKTAYRRLARTWHPDVVAIDRKDSSADEFMKIHAAYCTLSDPEKRAVYDRKLFRRNIARPLTSAAGFGGCSGRNWETDQCW